MGVRKGRESGFRAREKREAFRRAKIPFPFPGQSRSQKPRFFWSATGKCLRNLDIRAQVSFRLVYLEVTVQL